MSKAGVLLTSMAAWGSPAVQAAAGAVTPADLRDIRGPAGVDSLPPFALSGTVLLLIAGLFVARRHWRHMRQTALPPATVTDARDRLAALADDYRRGLCSAADLVVRLDALVRDTIASEAGIAARHLTSTELRQRADGARMLSETQRIQFDDFLELCDRTKFAGHPPTAPEIDAAIHATAGLIDAVATGNAA